jgi:hypothetical protein
MRPGLPTGTPLNSQNSQDTREVIRKWEFQDTLLVGLYLRQSQSGCPGINTIKGVPVGRPGISRAGVLGLTQLKAYQSGILGFHN